MTDLALAGAARMTVLLGLALACSLLAFGLALAVLIGPDPLADRERRQP